MATTTESFRDKINRMKKAAPRKGKRSFMGEGVFLVEILSTEKFMAFDKDLLKRGIQKRDKPFFKAEFKIVESTNPAHAPGSTGSWMQRDPEDEGGGAGDVKNFALALVGIDPKKVEETDDAAQLKASLLAYALMGEQEAFEDLAKEGLKVKDGFQVGRRVGLETRLVKTKAGGDFTVHEWSPA